MCAWLKVYIEDTKSITVLRAKFRMHHVIELMKLRADVNHLFRINYRSSPS